MDKQSGILKIAKKIAIIFIAILFMLLFNKITNNAFISQRNLTMLLKQASVLMILSSSLMMLLIEKNIDLSGGAGVYLTGVIVAILIVKMGVNIYIAIAAGIFLGLLMGLLNGFFIGIVGLPAFIVTLAAQLIFRGTGYVLTNAATIGPMPKEFAAISEAYISPLVSTILISIFLVLFVSIQIIKFRKYQAWYGGINKLINNIFAALFGSAICIWVFSGYKGIPMCVVIAAITVIVVHFITTKTVYGRHIYLIGGNIDAARLSGIKTEKRIIQSYIFEGLMYGVAGIVLTARLSGAAATGGNLLELDAVAAACIGGTSMNGGVGSILGVAFGVITLTAIDNVMSLMNVSSYLQMVAKGVILLIAVCIDMYTTKAKFRFKLINKK